MRRFDLTSVDPLVGTDLMLEIDGEVVCHLTSVGGLGLGLEGQSNCRLILARIAPMDANYDSLWKWFSSLRAGGSTAKTRSRLRKKGSIIICDSTLAEISRWNFAGAWPSKIQSTGPDLTTNVPISETITLQYETLTRVK